MKVRRNGSIVALLGGVTLLASGLLGVAPAGARTAAVDDGGAGAPITVQAGLNDPKDPTIALLQYMPAKVRIAVGATLTWSWAGTIEPHSVTFLAPGQQLPDPGSDPSLFVPTPPTGPYDGTAFVNSGLAPIGTATPADFSMTFAKAGTYQYFCVIHPNMIGTVDVVDTGKTDTAARATAAGTAQRAKWLREGRATKAALVRSATRATPTENADGTDTWTVQMGASSAHTDVLAFAPTPRGIKAGDSVTFVNSSHAPHTATFNGDQPPLTNPLDPLTDTAIPGPSPQTLDATGQFNTAELPPNAAAPGSSPPPKSARSFTFVVPAKGKYEYYCILHVPSGMAGTVRAS